MHVVISILTEEWSMSFIELALITIVCSGELGLSGSLMVFDSSAFYEKNALKNQHPFKTDMNST